MNLVPKEDAKVGAGYGDVLQKDGPVEFLNGTGVVCQNNNDYDTHFHATMCDASGQVFGGHIVKGYTPTLTTVDLIIFEIKNIEMLRAHLHHFLTALNLAYAGPARPQRAGSAALENYFGRLFGR